MTEACENCRFYYATAMRCRRHPPKHTGAGLYAQAPTVPAAWWCGEYQKAYDQEAADANADFKFLREAGQLVSDCGGCACRIAIPYEGDFDEYKRQLKAHNWTNAGEPGERNESFYRCATCSKKP